MVNRDEITRYLDIFFDISGTEDSSCNGLQIEGAEDIYKIGFAVDFCLESAKKALETGCQMLICHHGMIWRNPLPITGSTKKRVKLMLDNEISLVGIHLPLDMHPKLGNNAGIAALLPNFIAEGGFDRYKGKYVGIMGRLAAPEPVSIIKEIIDGALGSKSLLMGNPDKKIRTVGIISGGGASARDEAESLGLDLFITGEPSHACWHLSNEGKTVMLCAGHYNTETVGIKLLQSHIAEKYDIKTEFFDIPTGL